MNSIWKILFLLALVLWVAWFLKFADHHPKNIDLKAKPDYWGVTFSTKFTEELGLDWKGVYLAMLDDLEVKNVRLPIYWDTIEKEEGSFDFAVYDEILDIGAEHDVKFIVNVGSRLPRWPECHTPDWLDKKSQSERESDTLKMLKIVIDRYKDRKNIIWWQIENEPLLNTFGECPKGDEDFLRKEVSFVKTLDDRPIIISATGELSTWRKEVSIGDMFGTTMYRVVWNPWFGYFRYPWPEWFYNFKATLLGLAKDKAMIIELQAEPWVPRGTLANLSNDEWNKSFDMKQFEANAQFAINVDFRQAYLWGVEWWYLQKEKGNNDYWVFARDLFGN